MISPDLIDIVDVETERVIVVTIENLGDSGPPGATGPQGAQGIQGAQGDMGAPGPQGIQGPVGPAGPQGIQGDPGPTGSQGPQGSTGATGDAGPAGPQGVAGVPGPKGDPGTDGATGPAGPAGPTGADGPQGVPGNDGQDGAPGVQGPQGAQGAQGLKGDPGPTGATGSQGNVGPQGLKGDTGAQGIDGVQGPKGDTGAQGPQGIQGPQGPAADTSTFMQKSGDTMTGQLNMKGNNVRFADASNAALGYVAADPTYGVGFLNKAGTTWNFNVTDAGNATVRGTFTANGVAGFGSDVVLATPASNQYSPWLRLVAQGYAQSYIRMNAAASPPCLEVYNSSVNARNMTLDDSGNMTVRTTFYSPKIYADGTPGGVDSTNMQCGNLRAAGVQYGNSGTVLLQYDAGGGNLGHRTGGAAHYFTFQADGSGVCNNGSWISQSSREQKTNIRQIEGALASLLQLVGVTYTRSDDESARTRMGFIAEDVAQVMPSAVYPIAALDAHTPTDDSMTPVDAVPASVGLALGELTAPIVEAIRELAARIDALEQLRTG